MIVINKVVQGDRKRRISMPTYLCSSHRWGQRHQSFVIRCSYHIDTDTKCASIKENLTAIFLKCCLKIVLLTALLFGKNITLRKWFRKETATQNLCVTLQI